MGQQIFINYRRGDTLEQAQLLKSELESRIKGASVFLDVSGNRGAENFIDRINHEIADCRVFVCLIGPDWLAPGDGEGGEAKPRLHQKSDLVRSEIESAILRGKEILPIRVGGAPMPTANDLPDTMFTLPAKHARHLRADKHRDSDLAAITADVRRLIKGQRVNPLKVWRERAWIVLGALVAVSFSYLFAHALPDTRLASVAGYISTSTPYPELKVEYEKALLELGQLREEYDRLKLISRVSSGAIQKQMHSPELAMGILQDLKKLLDEERAEVVRLKANVAGVKTPAVGERGLLCRMSVGRYGCQ